MKKKNIAATAIALAAVLAAAPLAVGCSGDHYNSIKFDKQDTAYAVTSQGGSAVAYGNYMYFINGTRGYDDPDGDNNVWDKVVKGGLYRAELMGSADDGADYKRWAPSVDAASGLGFVFDPDAKDYFGETYNKVKSEKIAPKTVGTTGYENGGIFIYDNYVFFASPNNVKSKTGEVQTTRTDFFMMPLDGGKPTKIYTTAEGVDTSASAYAFYKFNDKVYLVANESGTIATVAIGARGKVEDPVKYEVNATSVYFPVRDTYYNGIDNNTVEDFIYFVRDVTEDDSQRAGSVIEAMRPDGSENFKFVEDGKTVTIESVRDGIVFYRAQNNVDSTVIKYTSLHDKLMEYSPTYEAAHKDDGRQIDGEFSTEITSSITATYGFGRTLYDGTGTVKFIKGDYLYFKGSNSDFYRVPLFANMDGYGEAQTLAETAGTAGIECDYAAGYFTYFATVDQWADNYTYFYNIDGLQGLEPHFVGTIAEADQPTEDEIKEILGIEDEE